MINSAVLCHIMEVKWVWKRSFVFNVIFSHMFCREDCRINSTHFVSVSQTALTFSTAALTLRCL